MPLIKPQLGSSSMGMMIRLRVHKGSKFLFECATVAADELPQSWAAYCSCVGQIAALELTDIRIAKRMSIAEVERIANYLDGPPQCIISPLEHKDAAPFQDLAAYLHDRERAGVATLENGDLLLLIPLLHTNGYLRCMLLNTEAAGLTRVDGRLVAKAPEPEPQKVSMQDYRKQQQVAIEVAVKTKTQEPEPPALANKDRIVLPPAPTKESMLTPQAPSAKIKKPKTAPKDPRLARSKKFRARNYEKMCKEYAALNAFQRDVLDRWRRSDCVNQQLS